MQQPPNYMQPSTSQSGTYVRDDRQRRSRSHGRRSHRRRLVLQIKKGGRHIIWLANGRCLNRNVFLAATPATTGRLPVHAVAPEDTAVGGQGQSRGSAEAVVARVLSHVIEEAAVRALSHVTEEAAALAPSHVTRNHTRSAIAANDPKAAVERKNTPSHNMERMMTYTVKNMGERETLAGLSTTTKPQFKAAKYPKGSLTVSLQKLPNKIRAKTFYAIFSQ